MNDAYCQIEAVQPQTHGAAWAHPPLEAYAQGTGQYAAQCFEGGQFSAADECLIEEMPVSLEFRQSDAQGAPVHALVMMATPLDLEAFALGFALTEGLVDNAAQVLRCDVVPAAGGRCMGVIVTLASGLLERVRARTRSASAVGTACGLCGLADIEAALRLPPTVPATDLRFSPAAIAQAFAALPALQTLGQRTGAAHAAAFADAQGTIVCLAEDAGRHNALDKLVGKLALAQLNPAQGFCLLTSRASFEMVQKAAQAGLPLLAAISAPTGLATRMAQAANLTLLAFVRGERFVCAAHPQRLLVQA